jgi:hypothetical protein
VVTAAPAGDPYREAGAGKGRKRSGAAARLWVLPRPSSLRGVSGRGAHQRMHSKVGAGGGGADPCGRGMAAAPRAAPRERGRGPKVVVRVRWKLVYQVAGRTTSIGGPPLADRCEVVPCVVGETGHALTGADEAVAILAGRPLGAGADCFTPGVRGSGLAVRGTDRGR